MSALRWMGIDPSANFGWAHGCVDEMPIFGVHKVAKGVSISKRLVALEDFLISTIMANDISEVWIERPILPRKTSIDAVMSITGYGIVTGMAAAKCGIAARFVDMQTWRSDIGSPTQAPKQMRGAKPAERRKWVKQANIDILARIYGINVSTDDEGDAVGIWKAVELAKKRVRDEPKFDLFEDLKV